ncbi:hypothetical protein Esti_002482 [Eimeria stiedai]
MAGPDPKRLYLAINSQNIQSLMTEKPYWSKPFVFVTPSGSGPKYTAFQAAMLLQKMKVVDFFMNQPSVNFSVKSTDAKNTLIVAVEAKMKVAFLEKLLQKLDLKCLSEVDSSGKGALDYADTGTEVFEFLHSLGCKTRQEREAAIAGFFGESVRGTVPGVSEHQRRRKAGGGAKKKDDEKSGKSESSSIAEGAKEDEGEKSEALPSDSPSEPEEEETTWRKFDDIEELEAALNAYILEWGADHEEGQNCAEWLRTISRAKDSGKKEKLLKKWNATVDEMRADDEGVRKEESTEDKHESAEGGRASNRAASSGSAHEDSANHEGEGSAPTTSLDREAVKLFFAGKAGDQVNFKHKGKHGHRLTFVVSPRSASAGPDKAHSTKTKEKGESVSSRRASSGSSMRARSDTAES